MKSLRVLLIEDEANVANLLSEVLVDMGHDVCAVEDCEIAAVRTAKRCRPDLMIVDNALREGSGVGAVEKILRARFVPHVFVSGDTLGILARRPDAVVIRKPFFLGDLQRAIRSVIATPVMP
jgi:CheY-like chemotaxis protein